MKNITGFQHQSNTTITTGEQRRKGSVLKQVQKTDQRPAEMFQENKSIMDDK